MKQEKEYWHHRKTDEILFAVMTTMIGLIAGLLISIIFVF